MGVPKSNAESSKNINSGQRSGSNPQPANSTGFLCPSTPTRSTSRPGFDPASIQNTVVRNPGIFNSQPAAETSIFRPHVSSSFNVNQDQNVPRPSQGSSSRPPVSGSASLGQQRFPDADNAGTMIRTGTVALARPTTSQLVVSQARNTQDFEQPMSSQMVACRATSGKGHGMLAISRSPHVDLVGLRPEDGYGIWRHFKPEVLTPWDWYALPWTGSTFGAETLVTYPHLDPARLGPWQNTFLRFDANTPVLQQFVQVPTYKHLLSLDEAESVLAKALGDACERVQAKYTPETLLPEHAAAKEYDEDWRKWNSEAVISITTTYTSLACSIAACYYQLSRGYRCLLSPKSTNGDLFWFDMLDVDKAQALGIRVPVPELMRGWFSNLFPMYHLSEHQNYESLLRSNRNKGITPGRQGAYIEEMMRFAR